MTRDGYRAECCLCRTRGTYSGREEAEAHGWTTLRVAGSRFTIEKDYCPRHQSPDPVQADLEDASIVIEEARDGLRGVLQDWIQGEVQDVDREVMSR